MAAEMHSRMTDMHSRWNVYILSGIFLASTALTVAVASAMTTGKSTSVTSSTSNLLPLGDNKYVTSGPKRGYIYLCNVHKDNFGAFQDGPWIQGSFWNPTKKPAVSGHVPWPSASMTISTKGSSRIITTNDLPSHTTGTYPIASTDDAYQYDHNPNSIKVQKTSVTLPLNPTVATSAHCMGGEVGIALTGVPIFNGFDATLRDAVAHELQDDHNGHPQEAGEYHYHNISDAVVQALTSKTTKGPPLIGYAYDGFGIFGPVENGKTLTNADLDECHGHTSTVMWNGKMQKVYHYNVTKEFPYTVGCFKGTPVQTGPSAGAKTGSTNTQNSQNPMGGPPQQAIDACSGKSSGSNCQFSDSHGSHNGTCVSPPGMPQACAPNR